MLSMRAPYRPDFRYAKSRAVVGASPWKYTADWTDEDFVTLRDIATSLKMDPADLLLVLASESGLKPSAKNPAGSDHPIAVGLNQMTSASNSATGLTESQRVELSSKSVAYQLPLVQKLFREIQWTIDGKTYPNAGVIYLANFAPSRMARGSSDDTVVYDTSDGEAYSRNAGFDRAGKGSITIGDLNARLATVAKQATYREALERLTSATGASTGGGAGGFLWGFLGVAAVGVGLWAVL